jgi:hypothetical protein
MRLTGVWIALLAGGGLGVAAVSCGRCARSARAVEPPAAVALPDAEFVFRPDAIFDAAPIAPGRVGRKGVPVMADGQGVDSSFARGSAPGPEHPGGTIGVLQCKMQLKPGGIRYDTDDYYTCDLSLIEVDVATATPIARVPIGDKIQHPVLVDGASGAIVFIRVGGKSSLVRFDRRFQIVARQATPALDADPLFKPCTFTVFGDEVVFTPCTEEKDRFVRSWTVDASGRVVAKHDCAGNPVGRYFGAVVRKRILLREVAGEWACSFAPDTPGATARTFEGGKSLFAAGDKLYFVETVLLPYGSARPAFHEANDELVQVGPETQEPPPVDRVSHSCSMDSDATDHTVQRVDGFTVISTRYCCGESGPSQLYICDEDAHEP